MTNKIVLSEEFLSKLKSITGKRAKVVIDHILEHGFITTEELEKTYGYNHPPRAARDVREQGIPLITFKVKSSDGRTIAAYKFGSIENISKGRLGGRKVLSKKLKDDLFDLSQGKCAICNGSFLKRYLQIDHKVPYEIAGDIDHFDRSRQDYMLLCASCNRSKSWSCEHCPNWQTKSTTVCQLCYWAFPENYNHIALREIRRVDILWEAEEISLYNKLKREAEELNIPIPRFLKQIIKEIFEYTEDQS